MNEPTPAPIIQLAGVPITRASDSDVSHRLSLLLWGPSGCGKTTLAATMPGRKLLVNFDPDGQASITGFDDVMVADLSHAPDAVADRVKRSNDPLGIAKLIDDFDSIIVDSMTNFAHKALMLGVTEIKGATIERPSPGAYQVRNALCLQLTKNLLRLTSAKGKHICFICHEAAPVTDDNGVVMHITLMLGGQLPEQSSVDFSEVWNMTENTQGKRRIAVRPVRSRKPMKTRMFSTAGAGNKSEFGWNFDADTMKGDRVSDWFDKWRAAKYQKIALPK